ncbi:MAG: MFS transporter [Candidatus Tectomicrobia bacterium]|uniref:MFS transporter n=1 Tax=Tectimicrobiota bacterium TaxID=2528274 RepID=A0A932HZS6_UNCTE|nr:MFS transporter [Candidatus Tectomicrobia bacterium]
MPGRPPLTLPFYYGWVIVALAFWTMAFTITARFSFAIYQVPLIAEFGWGRGALGGAYALMLATYALICPFVGSLFDRKGPRSVVPWGSALVGMGLALGFFVSSLWHVYVFTGLFLGVGAAMSGFALNSAMMPRWFQRKRGAATGIALSGSGIGILLLIPAIERLIAGAGWRAAYLAFGLLVLAGFAPVLWLLLRDRPEDVGQSLDGLPRREGTPAPPAPGHSVPLRQVLASVRRERNFWALALIVFFIGVNNNTVLSQLALYLTDAGFSTAFAALIFGSMGAIRMIGSMTLGWASDRLGRQQAQAIAVAISVAGLALLLLIPPMGSPAWLAWLFALVYGIGTGAMGTCHSAMAADSFGGRSFGAVMSLLEIAFGLGGALGPPLAGLLFDRTGSYLIPFSFILAGLGASFFLALFMYRPAGREGN